MLTRIEVRNFQSLHSADIPLGWFTVITGSTGSGKSALFRAMLTLARNARGTSYISHGQASCSVTGGGDDGAAWGRGWVVRLTRSSARTGKNEYRVAQEVPVPTGGYGWSGCTYTKLNGQVPPQVHEIEGTEGVQLPRLAEVELGHALAQELEPRPESALRSQRALGDGALDAQVPRGEPHDLGRFAVAIRLENDGRGGDEGHGYGVAATAAVVGQMPTATASISP